MIQTTPLQLSDFSGGITDNFIDSPPSKYQFADNFLISENRKLHTRSGVGVFDENNPLLPVGNQRVGCLVEMDDDLFATSASKLYLYKTTGWETIGDYSIGATISSVACFTTLNHQLYATADNFPLLSKVYKDENGDYQIHTAGMPKLPSDPTLSGTTGGGNNYIYAFHYFYEYKVGTVTHVDAGPVKYVNILDIETPDSNSVSIANIPELTNSTDSQYDVVNVKVKVYRTAANEETLYLLTTLNNGTTTYTDSTADSTLVNNGTLYTTGGVLDNDPPPRAKVLHISNNTMWYGCVKINDQVIDNRVMQSVINDPDSVPAANYIDMDDTVVGISSYMDRPLVFCDRSVYRIEGYYDEQGYGTIQRPKIADTVGCVNNSSIVQTPHGVFFASHSGFAFTDGFKCFTVSNDFNERYLDVIKSDRYKKIVGTYDKANNRVIWTVQATDNQWSENDAIFVCDVRWGVSENMSFTVFTGDAIASTALTFLGETLVVGDRRGYILSFQKERLSDVRVNTLSPVDQWGEDAILYRFKSSAIKPFEDFRAFIPRVIFSAKNVSNLSVQVVSDSDVGNRIREMKPIRWRGNFVWGDPMFYWGLPDFRWGVQGFIEHQRYFFSDDLRCTYKQIELKNSTTIVLDSAALSTATLNKTTKTVVLDDANFSWLDDMIGYQIYFDVDEYEQAYTIVAGSSSTLIVSDTTNTLPEGAGIKWIVRGVPKNEVLSLLNITLLAAPLGQTQDGYTASSERATP